MPYKFLDSINDPADLKSLSVDDLNILSTELKDYIITVVEEKGGHFSSPLGVVDLTIALHSVYDTPKDLLVWDVGHQCYPHKILTGRRDSFPTLRQKDGISGFCRRSESEYDVLGAGHASTSISAALGMAQARNIKGENHQVIAVIGDGAMTGGLAFEALNNVCQLKGQFLIVLNDNQMSISPTVGAISHYLTKVVTNPLYNRIKDLIWKTTEMLPVGKKSIQRFLHSFQEGLKSFLVPGMIFEELGIQYIGPIDGHDMEEMMETFHNLKDLNKPAVVHVLTTKGSGIDKAEADPLKYYSTSGNNTSANGKKKSDIPGYSSVFGSIAIEMAEANKDVCAVVAAMREGTGLKPFADRFSDRFFDVGIAEGHAVTFATGLAAAGLRPIVSLYSTFLQRGFDNVVHDASLQNLPVIFTLDRGGFVGPDGPTHHGSLDIAFLRCIQNIIITAPKDGNELRNLLFTGLNQTTTPFVTRYPKESALVFEESLIPEIIPIGSWDVVHEGSDVAILAVGSMVHTSQGILTDLSNKGISAELINCRFIKPMDESYLEEMMKRFDKIITVEDGVICGGFGEGVTAWLSDKGYTGRIKRLGHPDSFVEHGTRNELLKITGLDEAGIAEAVIELAAYSTAVTS